MLQYIKVFNLFLLFGFNILGIKNNFNSKINLCGWHVQKNLISHLSGLARRKNELYCKAINLPFISDKDKFELIYEELKSSNELAEKESVYLTKRYLKKNLWAKCYLKSEFGGGISTTSRIESFYAKLKQHLTSSSSLEKVFRVFKDLMNIQIQNFKEEFLRHGKAASMEKILVLV